MKQNKLEKILIASGILVMVAGLFGTIAGIYESFASIKFNETAGIGAVGAGLWFALLSNIGFFGGLLLLIIGIVKLARKARSSR